MEPNDRQLIAAAQGGSSLAFARLVDAHQQAVRGFLRRLCRNEAEADDLAQETFVTAWQGLSRFRGEASLRSWLCAIAWRKARDARRGLFRHRVRETTFSERECLERGHALEAESRLSVAMALAALPLEQRAAVALCLAEDFSHSEAAQILGLPLGTVKSHVVRGRARLLEALGERP
ncbi:MAG: polymerase subunit sigma-70 [Caulobacteraceae bacterium]|nr:polymerase subunit sigma-70 [Caulobacteraceae bacterium]